jgi:hypothetical protein
MRWWANLQFFIVALERLRRTTEWAVPLSLRVAHYLVVSTLLDSPLIVAEQSELVPVEFLL